MIVQYYLDHDPIGEVRGLHSFTTGFTELLEVIRGSAHSALVFEMYLNHKILIVLIALHYLVWV